MSAGRALDMDKLNAFIGRFVGDLGAAVHAGMVVIGEKLGLYKALAAGPLTSAELAAKSNGLFARSARAWEVLRFVDAAFGEVCRVELLMALLGCFLVLVMFTYSVCMLRSEKRSVRRFITALKMYVRRFKVLKVVEHGIL